MRFELRDPHSGFIAYVPRGSVAKGAALASSGGKQTLPCTICHGTDLNGLGPVPGIAGRSPSYIVRQFWDIRQGSRKGMVAADAAGRGETVPGGHAQSGRLRGVAGTVADRSRRSRGPECCRTRFERPPALTRRAGIKAYV